MTAVRGARRARRGRDGADRHLGPGRRRARRRRALRDPDPEGALPRRRGVRGAQGLVRGQRQADDDGLRYFGCRWYRAAAHDGSLSAYTPAATWQFKLQRQR